jgi:hypothetical protein
MAEKEKKNSKTGVGFGLGSALGLGGFFILTYFKHGLTWSIPDGFIWGMFAVFLTGIFPLEFIVKLVGSLAGIRIVTAEKKDDKDGS